MDALKLTYVVDEQMKNGSESYIAEWDRILYVLESLYEWV